MNPYEKFAEAWLRTGDPLQAALSMGLQGSDAFTMAREYPNRLEVICAKQDLIEAHGAEYFLPSKADQARAVWNKAQSTTDPDAYQKLMRLYAEIMGNMAPKEQKVSGNLQQAIVFEMIVPSATKPAINVTPERLQIETSS